jgi:hypothetical protein
MTPAHGCHCHAAIWICFFTIAILAVILLLALLYYDVDIDVVCGVALSGSVTVSEMPYC